MILNWCGSDLSQQGNSEQSTPNSPTSVKFDCSSIRRAKSHFLKFTGFHTDIYQRIHVRTKEKCIRQFHFLEICTHRPHFKDKDIGQAQLAYLRGTGFVQDQKVTRLIVYSHIYTYIYIYIYLSKYIKYMLKSVEISLLLPMVSHWINPESAVWPDSFISRKPRPRF